MTTRKLVLIMTDTQGVNIVGCYGAPAGILTPNIDGLARRGMRFDRAYTCQPVCGPARAALFTGTFPHSNGSWANCMPLGANVRTIGQRLAGHGFHNAYIGKWHLDGSDYFGTGRCPEGWDPRYWYDMRRYLEELSPRDRERSRRGETSFDPDITAEFTYAHRCSERAVDFLARHREEDFLLVVSYDEPHGPCLCPAPFNTMYRDYAYPHRASMDDPLTGKPEHHRAWAESAAGGHPPPGEPIRNPLYFGCNTFVDDEIGRVIAAVDRHAPDALVVYTSDHGDALRAHRLTNKGPAMYDDITRIPFIARWPGVTPEGGVCRHPVSHIDLVPTLLEAAGLPDSKVLEGRSLCAALARPDVRTHDAVFMEFARYETDHDAFGGFQPMRAAFDGRYKLAVNLLATDELYDLETDPDEMRNLIESPDHAAARDALHDRLLGWMNETRDPFRGYCWERRPWRKDARPASWRYTAMTRQREAEEEPRQLDYDTGLEMTAAVRRK